MSLLNPVLLPPTVKAYLSQGERFIKWDDETSIASPVILRVDPKGYYLYWTYQSKEMEFLDITSIRDTRFGKFAKTPKSQKLREVFNMDFPDNHFLLKALTVVSGPDMVDLTFHNFVSYKENVGKDWAEDILTLTKHPMTANAPRSTFLDKILVKLKMQLNPEGKIPVKNFFQMFPADRKRVEAALSACHLAKGKNDAINPEDFPESVYKSFLMSLCPRPEIDEIFTSYHAKAKPYMTKEHLTKFINQKQRDSRLNSLLFPPARPEQVQALIDKYEPSGINVQRGQLSPEGMVWFLCGPENSMLDHNALLLHQDMTQPLNHYFINSSHNTYLTAGQFSGLSSAEMYRQVLLSGCRCVELDCWKGKPPDEEPIITHGFTMTTDILFKEAIEAIAESAFKTSPYPVILSFENHVDSPRQQAKMAEYCRTMFGDTLLTEPLEKFPLKPGIPLPSPEDLRGKILIKNKKNQFSGPASPSSPDEQKPSGEAEGNSPSSVPIEDDTVWTGEDRTEAEEEVDEEEEEESGSLDEEEIKKMQSDEGTAGLEVTAYEEMSSLVNYIQPTKFISFEFSSQKNRSYVISSFTELKAYELLSKASMQFVDYNKRQMSRVYPKGTRMDSSNYMPQMFWNAGCQMVALNFQTMDLPMQQNMALFEFNGQSGYLLKHEFMRRLDKQFNPFSVDRIDVVVATTLSITVISGQFLSERSVRTYVEVEIFGLPGDPKRRYRTKLSPTTNSINPVWKEEPFVFEKILLPELASLRIAVMEEGNRFLGHRIIPINALRSGYHHLCLRSESNMPLTMPALFVFLEMKDYVPDTWADLTVALANPIKYFNAHDKKSMKLKEVTGSLPEAVFTQKPFSSVIPVARQSNGASVLAGNGSTAPGAKAKEEATKEVAEPQTASLEELQELKGVVKLQRRHEKELRELERRGARRWEELLQRGTAQLAELGAPGAACKIRPGKGSRKKRIQPCEETVVVAPSELPEAADPRVQELKDRLEQELQQQAEEQYRSVLKRKEQHVTEQIAKMMELAREKQAAELKTFKETSELDTKEVKKRLEAKRLERIQAMTKVTTDKAAQERLKREINSSHIQEVVQAIKQMTETLERHQEKLEGKQTACLERIRELEKQFQEEALAEYEARMKGLETEVKESVRACFKACFPSETEDQPERACEASKELCPQEPLMNKADTQESRL
ncbi:1-phosphatidylinositol 4,5-bisphosphate phosphodiesterase beta-2 isoform X1 [Alexandromys fortis]|uniref:1-phosphatidylinositol 4,5-bisphosphate phosphodiesterase beta-2 isoform X1 n=1 Tax=Alexandromys fortis TaxID=100897 RepID=UPI002152F7AF|nr:1-phosphatidylinositol 4,5-bisphosphate phosphodiesterase beta-2 isoform X1 [Microtus fortis]XP_049990301.1 1-phosphatidylinositol 4,5-bisphosphate phosphodiesterase beta-2 isoform X1 [Microtus fortis]